MYAVHQPMVASYAAQSPDKMADVYLFILATIQQNLTHVPRIIRDVKRRGLDSAYLWGFKASAYQQMMERRDEIYETLNKLDREDERLAYAATLPGLGLVKAGFLLQLCFGQAGCLDTHNINRFTLNPNEFKAYRFKRLKSEDLREQMVDRYLDLCFELGGSEALWNGWCQYVADHNWAFNDPFKVSEAHYTALPHAA